MNFFVTCFFLFFLFSSIFHLKYFLLLWSCLFFNCSMYHVSCLMFLFSFIFHVLHFLLQQKCRSSSFMVFLSQGGSWPFLLEDGLAILFRCVGWHILFAPCYSFHVSLFLQFLLVLALMVLFSFYFSCSSFFCNVSFFFLSGFCVVV